MPKVNLEEIDKLNEVVNIVVTPEDYEPEMKKELKKLASSQNVKGFRKGKTPISFIKKVYGKGVLGEIVSKMFSEELDKIMRGDDEVKYIGSPLLSKGQPQLDFKPDSKESYALKFELGKAPEFEVKGIDATKEFTLYKIKVEDKQVEKEYQHILESWGKEEDTEEPVAIGFLLKVNAKELDENGAAKADGVEASFNLRIDDQLTDDFLNAVTGKKKGDKFQFNIFNIYKNAQPEEIKQILLQLSKEEIANREIGESFELELAEVKKTIPATPNQELFDKVFGQGEVSNKKEAKARIKESLQSRKLLEGNSLLFREMRNYLVDQNRADMPLPEEFLKRYVEEENANQAEKILAKFDEFLDDLRWDLISSKLVKQFEIEVTTADIRNATAAEIKKYMGGYGDQSFLENMVDRMLQNQDHVRRTYEQVMYDKLFGKLKGAFKIKEVELEEEKLNEMYAEVFKTQEQEKEAGSEATENEASGSEGVTA